MVLRHALSGSDATVGTVAFHGGLNGVSVDNYEEPVRTGVLILTGGKDTSDSTKSVIDIERALNKGDVNVEDRPGWELTRYSDVEHGFTNFESPVYNERVDRRSWESTRTFLADRFGAEATPFACLDGEAASAEVVNYVDADGTALRGHARFPTHSPSKDTDLDVLIPAVVIVHDYGQELFHTCSVVESLGYVGFAADIFGADFETADYPSLRETLLADGNALLEQRISAAIEAVKALPGVDPEKVALFGYGLGGTSVIDYALSGQDGAAAVVSFHGRLSDAATAGGSGISTELNAEVLILSGGGEGQSVELERLEGVMEAADAPAAAWEYTRYSEARGGFTDIDLDSGKWYDEGADIRSLASARAFLTETLGGGRPRIMGCHHPQSMMHQRRGRPRTMEWIPILHLNATVSIC